MQKKKKNTHTHIQTGDLIFTFKSVCLVGIAGAGAWKELLGSVTIMRRENETYITGSVFIFYIIAISLI